MPDDFLTIDMISSFPGMVLIIGLLTQFTKKLIDKFIPNYTEYVVYVYSLLLIIFVLYAKKEPINLVTVVMSILNALVVALASMKGYEKILYKMDYKKYVEKITRGKAKK